MTTSTQQSFNPSDPVLRRALRALQRGRDHGFHFVGNFLAVSFDQVSPECSRVSLRAPGLGEAGGQVDGTTLGVLADMALAAPIRATLARDNRMATVNMQLQLTGAPCTEPLVAEGSFHGVMHGTASRQAVSRVTVRSGTQEVALGTATFMVLDLPPGVPLPLLERIDKDTDDDAALLDPDHDLRDDERAIFEHVRNGAANGRTSTATAQESYADRFWGYQTRGEESGATGTLANGPHIANRVGHVQGGVLLGFAQATARAALPPEWMLSSITAGYVSPGEGDVLTARAEVVHRGRTTAATRVEITSAGGRRVLEVLTTHSLKG